MENNECFDVTIIGGGCAGMFSTYYAGMRGLKTKVIDFLPKFGGTIAVFYPDKPIYDVGGIPKISGRDLVRQMKEQALMFDPTLIMGQAIDHLRKKEDGTFELVGNNGERHHTKTVIIAAGPGLFKVRRLHLDHIETYEGTHVHYEPADLTKFSGKRVAVYGGLNSSVEQAIELSKIARHVYLIYNRDRFQGLEKESEQLQQSRVDVKLSCKLTSLHGDGGRLSGISVKNANDGGEELLSVDELIVSQGYHFDLDPIKQWGFSLEGRRIPVNENMETMMPGVYAAGDIAGYLKKWRLIASAFNEAITAVNSANARINPSAPAQVYSSILMDRSSQ